MPQSPATNTTASSICLRLKTEGASAAFIVAKAYPALSVSAVKHKKYGEGVVTQLDDRLVHIMFQDDTLRMMDLKILANAGLLKVKK